MATTARSNISGNMLLYILGAIFLMGILIVLLKGSFQEGTGIDAEKVLLQVGEVQRFGSELERGVQYIMRNGSSEADLRFGIPNSPSSPYGDTSGMISSQVFAPEGGAVEWKNPPTGSQVSPESWIFSAANAVVQIGSTCGDSSCSDLLVILPEVTKAFCVQVNRTKNIRMDGGEPPEDSDGLDITTLFTDGTFTYAEDLNTDDNETDGKSEGCIESSGNYYYYRVLMAR